MTEEIVASNTTDARALASASLTRHVGATDQHRDGTLIEIGGGVFLTAGHVMYQFSNPGTVRSADSYTFHVGEGLDTSRDVTLLPDFDAAFTNGGWGTPGGSDMAFGLTGSTASVDMPLIVYADQNDAAGTLETFGYPGAGGYDGETLVKISGTLTTNSHQTIMTANGDMTVLVSDIGMQIYSGFSGAGVWLTNDVDGDGQQETYLAGIVSLDVQYVGGLHATGFEPLADIYAQLGAAMEAGAASADDFARATLVSGQSLGSANTSVTGTLLHEDLIGGQNADTLDGGGGNDMLKGDLGADTLLGGDGDDTLDGGSGADTLEGGNGKDVLTGGAGADVFVATLGGRTDRVLDLEKGTDVIDVSGWGVTQLSDMSIQDHASGRVILRYGKDALVLDDGARGLTAASFTDSDFIYATGAEPLPVIQGTAANDKLIGTLADEEIRDGAGVDNIFGKGGADLFVFSADGQNDAVKDFEAGVDRLDVSAWGASGFGDLTLTNSKNGKVLVEYGGELLVLADAARTLTVDDLSAGDFIFV
ncbi:MAG: hypothetical protein AAGB15_08900 [Pseudomonadota bacterium]